MIGSNADLSIIVVSWNVRALLLSCLKSIDATKGNVAIDVCVVDNNSTDGTVEAVRQQFPHVAIIANAHNRGFAAANNQGIAVAKGRHVMLLNPDTEWRDDSLRRLVGFMDAHADVGAVGPKLVNADGVTIQYWGGRRLPKPFDTIAEYAKLDKVFPRSRLCRRYIMGDWDHADSRDVECISGACLLVRREVVDVVGVMDEGYPLYSEDTDWCRRIGLAGWRIFYLGDAHVIHIGQQSSLQNRGPATVSAVRGTYRYYRKFHSIGAVTLVWAAIWLLSVAKLGAWFVVMLVRPGQRAAAWRQVQAYRKVCGVFVPFTAS